MLEFAVSFVADSTVFVSPSDRKKLGMEARENYLKMYAAYCSPPTSAAGAAAPNPKVAIEVCSNESLKKVSSNTAAWMSRQPQAAQGHAQGALPLPAVKRRCARIFAKCP